MLVLSRRQLESIKIGDDVEVVIVSIRGNKVRLGITRDVAVHRKEAVDIVRAQNSFLDEEEPK